MAAQRQKRETCVFRLGYPDFRRQLVINHGEIGGTQFMPIQFDDSRMVCLGNTWLQAAAPDQPLKPLQGSLPKVRSGYADRWLLLPSVNYPWVIHSPGAGQVFEVIVKSREPSPTPAPRDSQQDE
jgi:hypothetical protein